MVRVLILLAIVFLFIIPPPAHSLITDLSLEGKPIVSITVSAASLTPQDIDRMIGLAVGMPFSARTVQKALQPLYGTGLFNDIRIEAKASDDGVALNFIFFEKVFISKIFITGHTFSTKKVLNALNLQEGEEFSAETRRAALSRLLNFYYRAGYFQPEITLNTIPQVRKNTVNLDIQIKQGNRVKLKKILFVGNKAVPDVLLYFTLGVAEGFYEAARIEKGLQRLTRLYQKRGYIEATIGPPELTYQEQSQEVTVTVPIESGTQVKIFFEGNFEKESFFWRRPLEAQLLIKEQRSIDVDVLDESRDRLEKYFKNQGLLFARVSSRREDEPEKGLVNIIFDIQAGNRILLMSIRFEGNQAIPSKKLKSIIQTKNTGFLIPHIAQEKTIRSDIKTLVTFYRRQGFLNPKIKSQLTFNPAKDRADLRFLIEEGTLTLIDQVRFEGNLTFSDSELFQVASLSPESPYDAAKAKEAEFKILSHYSKKGYAFARVVLNAELKDEGQHVDLIYQITEDQAAFVGKIFLQGNTFTKDNVILRELLIHPNNPYDEEKIRLSVQRLYRLGFLREIRLNPLREEKEYFRDLLLSVKERKPGALDFGFGYGEFENFRGFVEISHRNLFGTGRRLSLRSELSQVEQKYTLSYKEPWFLSMEMDATAGLVHQIEELETFVRRTTGGTVGLDKSFGQYTKGSIQYQFEQNRCEDIQAVAVLTPEDQERLTVGSFNPSLVRDSRDDPFNPASGSINSLLIKDAAKILASESQFVKAIFQSRWYRSLADWLVLAISGQAGIARKFGETEAIHCSERFFLGGRSTVRGYARDRVGVPGQTLISLRPTGGNMMILFNTELRLALLKRLGLVLFLDGGNVWLEYPDVQSSEFKYSTGVGLRYNTPIGPLRLDWGYKLDREESESKSELHFTIGHAF